MQITAKLDRYCPARVLVISIHDVNSSTVDVVTDILASLRKKGVTKVSLLTVPDYHGKGKINIHPDFCRWLNEQKTAGHEIVLHGYFHLRPQLKREKSVFKQLVARSYTAGEGEFYDLKYAEALKRLEWGREVLTNAGFLPAGFIAPAWLLGREAEQAVEDAGFRYTVRWGSVTDFETGKIHAAHTLAYSTRAAWRRVTSTLWNPLLHRFCATHPLIRISIHPPDWQFSRLRAQILRFTEQALAVRSPMTYHEWVRLSANLS
jgi:predicted deacetylase